MLKQSVMLQAAPSIKHPKPQVNFIFRPLRYGLNVKPTHTDGNGCNWFSDTKNWLVEFVITARLVCCVCARLYVWCMFICVCVCPWCIISFTACDAALTVSSRDEENHYWQAVMANCEMEIKPLVITAPTLSLAHTDTQASAARQQWLQTNEQITSPSSPSLADWTQIVMRDMRGERRIILNAYKYCCH